MTPSFGSYLVGCLAVIGIVAALGLGGYWLRRWIVPEFSGALARLAEPRQGAAEFGHDPAPQPVAAEADRRDDADHGEAADYVGAERRCHEGRDAIRPAPRAPPRL